jgi:hypothetical protein
MAHAGLRCRCSVCGLRFNSTAAFDKHRAGAFVPPGGQNYAPETRNGVSGKTRRCLSVDEMRSVGMATNAAGCWISEKGPFPGLGVNQLAAIDATPYPGSALEPTRHHRTLPRGAEAVEIGSE